MLSRDDIKKAIAEGHIKIFPFTPSNLTGIGYNLTTTHFAFSINQGILLTVYSKTEKNRTTHYVVIPPNDTILFFTKEYIEVDRTIAGTFYSKVARVSEGLGHLSTTLDPTWKGQLLLSINNPTSKPIKFDLDGNGNIITVLFHKLDTAVTGNDVHDNNKGRCELLIAHFCEAFPNKTYQKRHLELKDFIEKELADSLNGYDDFLKNYSAVSPHSEAVAVLSSLQNRLQNDKSRISEDKYMLGADGVYSVFRDNDEKEAFKGCILYLLKKQSSNPAKTEFEEFTQRIGIAESTPIPPIGNTNLKSILPDLDICISIIKYQLDQINHVRRIEWHNARVHSFAGAKSELVLVRQKEQKKQRCLKYGVPIGIGMLLFVAIIMLYFLNVFTFDTGIGKAALAVLSAVVGAVISASINWWEHRKAQS